MINSFEMAPAHPEKILDSSMDAQEADGFVGHNDVPLCEQVFDTTEAESESVVEPNGFTDDLRGKPMAFVDQYHLTIFADRSPQLDSGRSWASSESGLPQWMQNSRHAGVIRLHCRQPTSAFDT